MSFEGADQRPTLTITTKTWVNPGIPAPVTDSVARQVRYDSRDSDFKAPYGAMTTGQKARFSLTAPRGVTSATLVVETRRLEGNQDVLEYLDPVRVPMTRTAGRRRSTSGAPPTASPRRTSTATTSSSTIDGQQYVYQNNNDSIYWTTERGSFGVGQIAFAPSDPKQVRRYRQTVYDPGLHGARVGAGRRLLLHLPGALPQRRHRQRPAARHGHLPRRPRRAAQELAGQAVRPRQRGRLHHRRRRLQQRLLRRRPRRHHREARLPEDARRQHALHQPDLRGGQQPQVRHRRLPATSTTASAPTTTSAD